MIHFLKSDIPSDILSDTLSGRGAHQGGGTAGTLPPRTRGRRPGDTGKTAAAARGARRRRACSRATSSVCCAASRTPSAACSSPCERICRRRPHLPIPPPSPPPPPPPKAFAAPSNPQGRPVAYLHSIFVRARARQDASVCHAGPHRLAQNKRPRPPAQTVPCPRALAGARAYGRARGPRTSKVRRQRLARAAATAAAASAAGLPVPRAL
jgi:hypothetical protein